VGIRPGRPTPGITDDATGAFAPSPLMPLPVDTPEAYRTTKVRGTLL
jgi:hypothetical protein